MRELDLLAHIYKSNPALPGSVIVPPGDDMGAVTIGNQTLLVTVDQVADGVHFDLATTPLEKIARKAITRNLSDVAAMAAKPVAAVAAACLPRDFGSDNAQKLFDAMHATANAYHCPLVGGDISMWDQKLILTVTLLAEPAGIEPVLRSGAQVGDAVCVTGTLGGSVIELPDPPGYLHHLDFEPRIEPARQLAADPQTRPTAMIDLSDGLAQDLARICEQSRVAARLDADLLPISPGARLAAERSGKPIWQHVLGDGEDYELCFTAPAESVPASVGGVPIKIVGYIMKPGEPHDRHITLSMPDGTPVDIRDLGWEHKH